MRSPEFWRRIEDGAARLEKIVLSVILAGFVFLAAAQILLRNLFRTGWLEAEPLLSVGLLVLTMLGALAATGARRHIALDLVRFLVPRRWQPLTERLAAAFAAWVCGWLAVVAGRFCWIQRELEPTRIVNVPMWIFQTILPAALALMALRFALQALGPHAESSEAPK